MASQPPPPRSSDGGGADHNPFVLPSAEDQFRARQREAEARDAARRAALATPIWDKAPPTSTLSAARRAVAALAPDVDPAAMRKARRANGLVTAATSALSSDRRRERESMSSFIAKKREMFMLQMSIDMKKGEIAALERGALEAEAALARDEAKLEQDASRFDAFLKESDAQAHEALRRADAQSRAKTEKAHELKKLQHTAGALSSEKARLHELLDEYRDCKAFLDALTPPEWTAQVRAARDAAVEERRVAAWAAKRDAWDAERARVEREVTERVDAEGRAALRAGQLPAKPDVGALVAARLPPAPALDAEPAPPALPEEADDALPMFFTEPEQLLSLFTSLEESNLFLISNCQDTEQALDELRVAQEEAQAAMAAQAAALDAELAALETDAAAGDAAVAELSAAPAGAAGAGAAAPGARPSAPADGAGAAAALTSSVGLSAVERLLPQLRARIAEAYARCGFSATATSDSISMLTVLEGRLEGLLAELAAVDRGYVAAREKEKEMERRVRVREARLAAQREAHEARQRKILERALQPSAKRTGKPLMTRSLPFEKKAVEARPSSAQRRAAEDAVYLS